MKKTQLKTFLKNSELGLSFLEDLAANLESHYREKKLPRNKKRHRLLQIPDEDLNWVQTRILKDIFNKFKFPEQAHGGIRSRSPRTNAENHTGQEIVLNLDLEDFFDNIKPENVRLALTTLPLEPDLIDLIARLTIYKDALPQGAPTSVFLANLVALELDQKLLLIAEQSTVNYTRYIDDLTFSGDLSVVSLVPKIKDTIEKCGYKLNHSKTLIQRRGRRQVVTGVTVNEFANVPRTLINSIKTDLHFCEKFGIFGHCEETDSDQNSFTKRLAAMIGYVLTINPTIGNEFMERFRKLSDYKEEDRHFKKRQTAKTE